MSALPPPDLFGVWRTSPFRGQAEAMLVHLAIADIVNDAHDYRLWITVAGLAEKAGVSVRTVQRVLKELCALDILEVLTEGGGRGKATEYRYLGNHDSQAPFTGETVTGVHERVTAATSHPLTNTRNTKSVAPAKKQRKTAILEDWQPTEATKEWARSEYPVHANSKTLAAFRDYYMARGTALLDWDRAFRNWVRKEADFRAQRTERGPARTYL